jgi:hypothetical protein
LEKALTTIAARIRKNAECHRPEARWIRTKLMAKFAKSRGRARLGPLDHFDRSRVSGDFCFDARNRGGVAARLRQRKRSPQQAKRRLRRAARAVPGCARHREQGIVRGFRLAQLRQPGGDLLAGRLVLAAQRTSEERRHRRPVGKALGKRQRVPPRAGIRQTLDRVAGEGPHGVGSRLTGIRVAQRPRNRRRRLAIHPTERGCCSETSAASAPNKASMAAPSATSSKLACSMGVRSWEGTRPSWRAT